MQHVYHVTPKDNLTDILASGLSPQIGPRAIEAGEKSPAIYCFANMHECENGILNWLGEVLDEDQEIVILEVLVDGLSADCSLGWEISIFEPIPATRILRVYQENEFADF